MSFGEGPEEHKTVIRTRASDWRDHDQEVA